MTIGHSTIAAATSCTPAALHAGPRLYVRWRARAGAVTDLGWSADGRVLAVATRSGAVHLVDGATGQVQALLTEHAGGATAVAWRPCGTVLATSGNDATIRCFDRSSLDLILEADTRGLRAVGLSWSSDGAYLAARVGGVPTVWSLGARSRPLKRRLARCVAWHPTDSRVFVADAKRITSLAIDGKPSLVTLTSTAPIASLAVRPDAGFLAAMTTQGPAIWDLATGEPRIVPDLLGASAEPGPAPIAWSPTMPWLIAARGGAIRVWSDPTAESRWLHAHAGVITALVPLPCGRRFVSSGKDGAVHVWHIDRPAPSGTGRHAAPLTLVAAASAAIAAASADDRLTAWSL